MLWYYSYSLVVVVLLAEALRLLCRHRPDAHSAKSRPQIQPDETMFKTFSGNVSLLSNMHRREMFGLK